MSHPPALLAEIDPVAIRRVLDNLVANAVRHAPPHGHVRVDAERHQGNADGTLTLRVRDDGPGFPPAFLPHAFDRFTRADHHRSRADRTTGSGLGLAIARSLIHAHHGTITATNQPRGGAEITIRLSLVADGNARSG
ncbi:MAG: sensor histidine kinase [Jatrophihabitantaceae bacterium]